MHILILTNRIPYPLRDGGSLAMHYFIEGYIEAGVKVSLLAMNTSKHYIALDKLPSIYKHLQHFESVYVNNDLNIFDAFKNLFQSGTSYNVSRFESKAYDEKLQALLEKQQFDFIQLEGLFLTPYVATIRKYQKEAQIILRSHNIEYKIWDKLYHQANNPIKKWYLKLLTQRLKAYEYKHLNDYDIILPISDVDKCYYVNAGVKIPIYTQTFGIKVNEIHKNAAQLLDEPLKLYHIGAMDWLPNQESIKWLIEDIMPEVYKSHPNVKLYLAGRNMPKAWMEQTYDNIEIIGEVPDAYEFEKDKDILLVPLKSGGGVRIKIFQSMAMGKAVITTPVGVEGIEVKHREHLLIAENKDEFVKYIRLLIDDKQEVKRLGKNAQQIILNTYDREKQIQQLIAFLQSQLH